jgi:hypothetical protein
VDDSKGVIDVRRPALALLVLSLGCSAGCGAKGGHATTHPSSTSTGAAGATGSAAGTGAAAGGTEAAAAAAVAAKLHEANRAEADGRAADALALYESAAAAPAAGSAPAAGAARPIAGDHLQALICAARLRLSANPTLRDLTKARAHLADVSELNPKQPATIPVGDLVALLDDAASFAAARDQQDQRASALRGENRTLKNTIKTLQEELAKKDEALHRATEKLLDKAPPPH